MLFPPFERQYGVLSPPRMLTGPLLSMQASLGSSFNAEMTKITPKAECLREEAERNCCVFRRLLEQVAHTMWFPMIGMSVLDVMSSKWRCWQGPAPSKINALMLLASSLWSLSLGFVASWFQSLPLLPFTKLSSALEHHQVIPLGKSWFSSYKDLGPIGVGSHPEKLILIILAKTLFPNIRILSRRS